MTSEESNLQMKSHKHWRRIAKKFRRKRIRRKLAQERDRKANEVQSKLVADPVYQSWLRDQEELEKYRAEVEQREHDGQEEQWMRRELLAQKRFREEKKRQQDIEQAKEKERQRIQKEFEEQQKIIQEQIAQKKRMAEEQKKKHELLLRKIDEYINEGGELPPELYESADSNPGKEVCPFFLKTAACRFGNKCLRNHSRPGVSRILFIPHFFTHIRLDQPGQSEYGTDLALEYCEDELNAAYEEFFTDVTEELLKYGDIVNFRTCKNTLPHLRGNVLIEFKDERSSLKAYKRLLGRYYACRRINVEFCKLVSWKSALCVMGNCPKGSKCNYLHIFKNPFNKYNVKDPLSERPTSRRILGEFTNPKPSPSWNEDSIGSRRHWRWSESPELDSVEKTSDRRHSGRDSRSRRSSDTRKESKSSRRESNSMSSSHRRRSRSRSVSNNSSRRKRNRSQSRSRKYRTRSISPPKMQERSSKRDTDNSNYKNQKELDTCCRSTSKERKKRKRRRRSKSKTRKKNK